MKITLTGTKLRQGMDRLRTLDKKKKCFLLFGLLAVLLVLTLFIIHKKKEDAASAKAQTVRTAAVTRQDIRSTLSGSGTISPKDTYSITSMADGEVVEADFEEGDEVSEGQVLYRIDASSMESKLKSAGNTLERAQSNYDTAEADYQEALSKYSGNTYKSTKTGYIKNLYIEAGDKVGSNTQIADIYNDSVMKIKIPFLNVEAAQITAGMPAVLTLSDTLEQIEGVVSSVSAMDEALTGGRLIRYVTIEAANPGGLMTSMTATAQIGAFTSSGDGNFTPKVDTVMGADLSGQVDVEQLLVAEGSFVSEGTPIFRMKANSAEKLIKSYKDSLDQAESSLEQAQSSLDTTRDTYDDYTVTAPISGTVITKTVKLGDKIQNGNSATSLAVIYDMSSVTFQMNVDELDIIHVQNGQKVEVVADAFAGQTFTGKVTNISLEGTSSNGVTYYPVTVTLDEVGELRPGMNVEGTIIVDAAEDVLAVPADALQRGNSVYVKDDTVTESQGRVPAGFREVKVETGLISEDYVEIVSGDLEEGDEVSLASTSVPTENDSKNAGMNGMGGMGMPGTMPPAGGSGGSGGGNKNWNGGGSGGGNGAPGNRG
ncbi:MAG: efflux RND transporter periplasmic adaptor subunit [Clostridiaceae bacterium]|nr:efflux RND transporter periplasmic adaptor subunit [Clostridiaceae bacterium]